jgi:hypothetical protein
MEWSNKTVMQRVTVFINSSSPLILGIDAMEWSNKTVMQPLAVFRNLSSPLILGIDAIFNLGITYLSRTKGLVFQEALNSKEF